MKNIRGGIFILQCIAVVIILATFTVGFYLINLMNDNDPLIDISLMFIVFLVGGLALASAVVTKTAGKAICFAFLASAYAGVLASDKSASFFSFISIISVKEVALALAVVASVAGIANVVIVITVDDGLYANKKVIPCYVAQFFITFVPMLIIIK